MMSHRVRRLARRLAGERGQALVETAIALPVVALLLLSIVDGGRIFHAWIVTTNAAREGARVAATRAPQPEVLNFVQSAMVNVTPYQVTTTNLGGTPGTPVTVEVRHDVAMLTPLIGSIVGNAVTVRTTAVMRLE